MLMSRSRLAISIREVCSATCIFCSNSCFCCSIRPFRCSGSSSKKPLVGGFLSGTSGPFLPPASAFSFSAAAAFSACCCFACCGVQFAAGQRQRPPDPIDERC